MLGINEKRTTFFSYVICGLTAGIAGFVFIMTTGAGNIGNGAVVIGGTFLTGGAGYVFGTVFGVLIFGTIQAFINFNGTLSAW